jgi:chromosome partitioning protein
MKSIAFISIKGGCGKSSLSILTANMLASMKKKVLFIDADVQNSASFYYLENATDADSKNIARALMDGDLCSNIVRTNYAENLHLIPSAFGLLKLRGVSTRTLSVLISQVKSLYDFVIIDTAPTLDAIVLNAALASDVIITPCGPSTFDWKSTMFLEDQLAMELGPDTLSKWHVLRNMWKNARTDSPDAIANQYDSMLMKSFPDYLLTAKIPDTTHIKQIIDFRTSIEKKGREKLLESLNSMI